jgi:hypothetical protein
MNADDSGVVALRCLVPVSYLHSSEFICGFTIRATKARRWRRPATPHCAAEQNARQEAFRRGKTRGLMGIGVSFHRDRRRGAFKEYNLESLMRLDGYLAKL